MRANGRLTRCLAQRLLMFESVARHRGVSAAAAELDLTPREVSRSLRELESMMATRVFTRDCDGVGLTQAGEILHLSVSAGLAIIREVADRPEFETAALSFTATV